MQPPPPPACQQTAVPPPPNGHLAVPCQQQLTQQVSAQPAHIPTYEIVTSCQPAVVYSNGYYYTSFVHQQQQEASPVTAMLTTAVVTGPPTVNVVTMSPGGCLA